MSNEISYKEKARNQMSDMTFDKKITTRTNDSFILNDLMCQLRGIKSISIDKQIDERNGTELSDQKKRRIGLHIRHMKWPVVCLSLFILVYLILDSVFVHSKTNRNKRIDYTNIPPKSKLSIPWCTIHHQLYFTWSVWIFGEHRAEMKRTTYST